jgi:hypothetical protein
LESKTECIFNISLVARHPKEVAAKDNLQNQFLFYNHEVLAGSTPLRKGLKGQKLAHSAQQSLFHLDFQP